MDAKTFFNCAETLTYNQSEIILGTKQFDTLTLMTTDLPADWDLMSYSINHGRCYMTNSLGKLNETKQITLPLNKSVSYRFYGYMTLTSLSSPGILALFHSLMFP